MRGGDVLEGIFGLYRNEIPVRVLTQKSAEIMTKRIIGDAVETVDHLTIIGRTCQFIDDRLARNKKVKKRVLLLNAEKNSRGFKTLRSSEFQDIHSLLPEEFMSNYRNWYNQLKHSNNMKIRVYSTVPWMRCTIVDNKHAVFLMTINLIHGPKCSFFYTNNLSTVSSLHGIFDDVWYDEKRTMPFESFYKKQLKKFIRRK